MNRCERTIVPLPRIFRPDFETAGFWSDARQSSSVGTLRKDNESMWTMWYSSLMSQRQFLERQIQTDISVMSSWDGMSRRSRKRFSGTGGISSGRTTGFSLLLCSFSPSPSSSLSGASPSSSAALQELYMEIDAKEHFVMQKTRVTAFLHLSCLWCLCDASKNIRLD